MGIMDKLILFIGIEVLNGVLCVYLAYVLLKEKEEMLTLRQKALQLFEWMLIVVLNAVNLPILYYNNVVWIQTDLFFLLFFKFRQGRHNLIRAGIAILVRHLIIYMDYAIGFLLVGSKDISFSMETVLYSKKWKL